MTATGHTWNQGLDFFLPMQTRKWLALLREDPIIAYRIQPDLDLPREELGFRFRSNGLGLHGPDNCSAPCVAFGTSFAMGFAVDEGLNWFDRALAHDEWLNLGLPVGPVQLESLFRTVYRGDARLALVVYHPNFWTHAKQYGLWAASGQGAFEFFHWETDRKACFQMQLRALQSRAIKVQEGRAASFAMAGAAWFIDSGRDCFDFTSDYAWFQQGLQALERMLAPFSRVLVVRAPVKTQACPPQHRTEHFRRTLRNYDLGWRLLQDHLPRLVHAEFHDPGPFDLTDFHPLDLHWNEQGNARFAQCIAHLLR